MRSSKVELCMICEDVPCSCGKPKKTPVRRAIVKSQPQVEAQPRSSAAQDSIRERLRKQKLEAFTKRFLIPKHHRTKNSVDLGQAQLASALRALESLLHPEELEKHRVLLTSEPSLDERAATWRARNGGNLE